MKLSITLTKDESAALLALKDGAVRLVRPLARAWGQASQEVLGRAVKNRFTGRGPFPVSQNKLGVRTNRLRKSMRATAATVETTGNIVSNMGSNVSYYAPHEFGFRGRVQVQGHTRRGVAANRRRDFKSEYSTFRGKLTKASARGLKANYKRGRANFSYVRPHSRRVNIPARRPLGAELDRPQTRLTFTQKIKAVLRAVLKPKP